MVGAINLLRQTSIRKRPKKLISSFPDTCGYRALISRFLCKTKIDEERPVPVLELHDKPSPNIKLTARWLLRTIECMHG